jgi:hypothetical protein
MVKDKKIVFPYLSANKRLNIFLRYIKKVSGFFNIGRIKMPLQFLWALIIFVSCTSGNKNSPEDNNSMVSLPAPGEDFFLDVTHASGINFRHTIGDHHLSNLVESVGGGAAWIDFDQDGFLDLYVVNGAHVEGLSEGDEKLDYVPVNQLFRNMGNGTFSDVTKKSRTGDTGYGMGVTVGDYDNDGYPDIYISNYGPNVLYHNNGNGTFTDVSVKAVWLARNAVSVPYGLIMTMTDISIFMLATTSILIRTIIITTPLMDFRVLWPMMGSPTSCIVTWVTGLFRM